jgi:DNA-directed RNA polymerase subunit M/transcription elongation factor TFIIS
MTIIHEFYERFSGRYLHRWCGCNRFDIEIVGVVCSNDIIQYRPCCIECGYLGNNPISYKYLSQKEKQEARIYRVNPKTIEPACERCGSEDDVEVHHWAPQTLFGDADHWPTSVLCKACHVKWHSVMRGARNSKDFNIERGYYDSWPHPYINVYEKFEYGNFI